MDNYVEGYFNDPSLLAYEHAQQDVACLECHEATLSQQAEEGMSWVARAYAVDETGDLSTVGVTADKEFCAKSGCHDWEIITASTQDWGGVQGVNPHSSHQGEAIDCSNCHQIHGQSYMYCNTCHDYALPAGWLNPHQGGE